MKQLYYNGNIYTMAKEGERVEALLTEDGVIKAAGSYETLRAENSDACETDLLGKTLMPAFVDGHSHFLMAMQIGMMADLASCSNFEEIVSVMKTFIQDRKITESGVAIGWGYDHNFLPGEQHPDRHVLDQISQTVPVCIVHTSGHMGCVNTLTLKLAGITSESPDPPGGKIGREPGGKEPSGYLEEAAMFQGLGALMSRLDTGMVPSVTTAEKMYLAHGITTVQEGGANEQSIAALMAFNAGNQLTVDVVAYPLVEEKAREIIRKFPEYRGKYHGHLKIGGCKIILDGSPQGKSAWLTQPYENSGDYRGYPKYSDELVETWLEEAVEDGVQVLAHCNGDAAGDQFLQCYNKALETHPEKKSADLRPVMIHCQTARKNQLEKMAPLGMIASIFTGHVYFWGDVHRRNLGAIRGANISPCQWALDAGLTVNFHQDMPVTRPDMLHSIWCAVNRITRSGKVLGESQKISVYEAFRAASYGGAYAYHEEDSKGTLEPGKKADMIILDRDPFAVDPIEIRDIQVMETIKDGAIVYQTE